ncbi:hypothetical protein HKX48_003752 [Thoreauomyces humboldtii]|nr:hypothetical protein HKX48_003752 [Thoreauomyces humboldtii]
MPPHLIAGTQVSGSGVCPFAQRGGQDDSEMSFTSNPSSPSVSVSCPAHRKSSSARPAIPLSLPKPSIAPAIPQAPTLIHHLSTALSKRKAQNLLRTTPVPATNLADFSSNNYLGLSGSRNLNDLFLASISSNDAASSTGSTGSRLLTGNSSLALSLEARLARYHAAPSAILFNSGYDANLALMATLPQPTGAVVYDEMVHASMHDGIRLGRARTGRPFRHNDVEDLARVLEDVLGGGGCTTAVVAVEALYSMDGDVAPLGDMVDVLDRYGGRAVLVVDEAHSTGTVGRGGRGLVCSLGLTDRVFARLHTFGKAVGAHGAVVVGPAVLRDYLVNYARPLVYSTMMAPHALVAVGCAYDLLERDADALQRELDRLVRSFRTRMGTLVLPQGTHLLPSDTMIQGIVCPGASQFCMLATVPLLGSSFRTLTFFSPSFLDKGNAQVVTLSNLIRSRGFDVRPIRSPTVPAGTERVRVCLHADNTDAEVIALVDAIAWAIEGNVVENNIILHRL